MRRWRRRDALALIGGTSLAVCALRSHRARADTTLLNVSYDPTRELYKDFNAAFAEHWQQQTGEAVTIQMSHGGSGKQARAVIDGLEADVVTLALAYDIDAIAERTGWLPKDWQSRLPDNSAPYTSTIVFLVRKGNPKGIKDWGDLVKRRRPGDHAQPQDLGRRALELPRRLGLGAAAAGRQATPRRRSSSPSSTSTCRCSTPARAARPRPSSSAASATCCWPGRTRPSWRSQELGQDEFEIVVPSLSILAEPPVAVVDHVVDKHGTRKVAEAYLEYLYSPAGQRVAARHYYRPIRPEDAEPADLARFPKIELITVDEVFGGWQQAQKRHFADGGIFDQIATQ